jgi:ferredoxin-NADP reductase
LETGPTFRQRASKLAEKLTTPLLPAELLGMFDPRLSPRAPAARIVAVKDEHAGTRTITLEPRRGYPRFTPGQHLDVGVVIEGVVHTRTFSFSSAPDATSRTFSITVRANPKGRATPHFVERVRVGDLLRVSEPRGEFVLRDGVRQLFITAGSGITPVMSMLRARADADVSRDVAHLHYERSPERVIFGAELDALAANDGGYRLERVFTDATALLDVAALERVSADFRERETFVCGPPTLIDAVTEIYAREGLAQKLHVERFTPLLSSVPEGAEGGAVSFTKSGRSTRADAKTPLLLVAEKEGLKPIHGCRRGMCHSCEATLVKGCVRDLRDGRVTSERGARIQICISAAASDVEIEL